MRKRYYILHNIQIIKLQEYLVKHFLKHEYIQSTSILF